MSVASVSQSKAAQQLSIHRVSLSKICRYFSIDRAGAQLLNAIQKVIDLYNRTLKDNHYTEIAQHHGLADFHLIIYAQVNHSHSRLARWIQDLGCEQDLTSQRVHYIFFFYRQFQVGKEEMKEIFAATSGQAYRVVQKFSDFRFPGAVARRLFDPKILSSKNRPLVGDVLTYSEILKEGTEVSDAEAVNKLFTRVRFALRRDSSLFALPFFQNSKGGGLHRGIGAEFGLGLIRFGKDIHPDQYPALLSHLSIISRGEPTHAFAGAKTKATEVEKDSDEFDFLDYLHPVDFSKVPQLEKTLVNLVHKTVVQGEPFPPLDFCHKNRSEYFHGTDHQIHYDGKTIDCPASLSAPQMVQRLKNFKGLVKIKDAAAFTKELAKVTVSFSSQGKTEKDEFIKYLEGEMRDEKNGDVYWRLHTMWFEVQADYLGIIHQEFGKMVGKTLMGNTSSGSLSHLWPSPSQKEKNKAALKKKHEQECPLIKKKKTCKHKQQRYDVEAEYNQSYLPEVGVLLGDKICPQGIELFDILRYTQQELFLYHVKEGFGQKTRDACSQVYNAAHLLHSLRHRGFSNIAAQFFREATGTTDKKYPAEEKKKLEALGEKEFVKLFKKKIVFVYAFIDDSDKEGAPRWLSKDKGLKTRITPGDIVKAHDKFKKQGKKIFEALVKAQYLTPKGHLTSKFFAVSSKAPFNLTTLKVAAQRKALYQHLSTFGSQFDSTIAKLELLRIQRDLENLGFEFRICQIRRTDYPKDSGAASADDAKKDYASLDGLDDFGDDDLASLRKELVEDSDFTHGEDRFHIHPTKGDGACGLHALLGVEKEDEYVYDAPHPNAAVRKHFITTLRARYAEMEGEYQSCLVNLLKDYRGKNPSQYVKTVFDPLKDQMAELSAAVEAISTEEDTLKETQEEQFEAALEVEDDEIQTQLATQLGASLDLLRADAGRRNGLFRGDLDGVLQTLQDTEEGTALTQTRDALTDLEAQRDALYAAFVIRPEVLEAYVAACQKGSYYFSEREIGLAAHLFDKRAIIFAHRHLDQVFDPMPFGDEENDEVVIFHKGVHFSRCERLESEE
jgi:hypothetical protein